MSRTTWLLGGAFYKTQALEGYTKVLCNVHSSSASPIEFDVTETTSVGIPGGKAGTSRRRPVIDLFQASGLQSL